MNKLIILSFLLIGNIIFAVDASAQKKGKKPIPIILDTDIGPDYDDVGAVAMLHALADKGEAKPLAIIASNKNKLVAPSIDILNTYFRRPYLPIGAPKNIDAPDYDAAPKWPQQLIGKYPHQIKSTDEVIDAVALYRKLLSEQPDKSVTIVTIGFLTNMANLLNSVPDKYSTLSGKQLIAKKVKQLVSMAGKFPSGREFNIYIDSAASAITFNNWPTPVLYTGYEIGDKILTGKELINNHTLQNNPVKDAYERSMNHFESDRNGRMSWDQTAVLVAVRGTKPYYNIKRGTLILKGGYNEWKETGKGKQAYLVEKMNPEKIRSEIEILMMHTPTKN